MDASLDLWESRGTTLLLDAREGKQFGFFSADCRQADRCNLLFLFSSHAVLSNRLSNLSTEKGLFVFLTTSARPIPRMSWEWRNSRTYRYIY